MSGKGQRKKSPPTPAAAPRRSSAWPLVGTVGRGLLALALVTAVMMAVVWVGGQTGRVVAPQSRYAVEIANIRTPTPPSNDPVRFLLEVRYLGDLPERVQSVDPNLKPRLTHAFGLHPWVESVRGVEVTPAGEIRVALTFRQPVLAVAVVGETAPRLVDKGGILLPGDAPGVSVSTLKTPQPKPETPAGQPWASKTVQFSATLAATYRPQTIERTKAGMRLILAGGREQMVLWDGA